MKPIKQIIFFTTLFILANFSYAQSSSPSIVEVMNNGEQFWVRMFEFVKIMAPIIGLFLIIVAVFKLSQVGSSPQATVKQPIFMFLIGISLIAITPTLVAVHNTLLVGASPGAVLSGKLASKTSCGQIDVTGVLVFVKLVGLIAFVRGWLLLNQAAAGKDGVIGRGLTHIFGGVAAVNVIYVAKLLNNTFYNGSIPCVNSW